MLNFFIERPIFSTVLSLIITLAGALAALSLPVSQYPQIVPPQVTVTAAFPGANADVMLQSVAAPIEQQVNGAERMLYLSSFSGNDGTYTLRITFDVGTNQSLAAVDVQNRVSAAQSQLPADVTRNGISVRRVSSDFLQVISLTSPKGTYDQLFLSNYALLNLVDELARVPGIGNVRIFGQRDYSIRLWLDPERMSRLGVTTGDVVRAVQEQNQVAPAGGIGTPPAPSGTTMQYSARVQGRLTEPKDYEDIVLAGDNTVRIVRLRDIGRAERAAADYAINGANDNVPSALVGVFLQPDANALQTAEAVQRVMQVQAQRFPPDMQWSVPYSTTPFIRESMKEVLITLAEAFVLVVIVVFLFLQSWRATLIPIAVIPVSLIGSFAAFAALGFSINTLTLFGLVLAIGIVVDDAIVVVEAIQQRLDSGRATTALQAARDAMGEVGAPVIAIALALLAVFVPVAFVGGLTGQLYQQFALTLAVSITISAVCALTLTPALCALLLRPVPRDAHPRPSAWWRFGWFNTGFDWMQRHYDRSLNPILRRAVLSLAMLGIVVVAAYGLMSTRPVGLVPEEDQGYLLAVASLPPGASLERTDAVMRELSTRARALPGVEGAVTISGLNLLTNQAVSYSGSAFIRLRPFAERTDASVSARMLQGQLMGQLNGALRDANVIVLNPPPIRGLGTAGGFTFVLQDRLGADPQRLAQGLQTLLAQARTHPEIGTTYAGFDPRVPQIQYDVDRDQAKSLGVTLTDIYQALQVFLGGYYVNDFNLYGRTFRVIAQANPEQRAAPEDVARFFVRSTSGELIPLSALVRARSVNGPQYFERFNLYSAATINGGAAPGYSTGQAMAAMEAAAATLPPGFNFAWSEASFQERRSGGQAVWVFALSVAFVFLVLAALYESWLLPIAILLLVPFAVFGAYLGLALRALESTLYTQIALIMLIGLAAKNAILVVEFAKLARDRGANLYDAAKEAARLRLRPILMTSLAFIVGALPLALASGAGAGARRALGTAVVFGMSAATLIGIFVVPAFYVLLQRLSERRRGDSAAPPTPTRADQAPSA